MTTSLDGEVSVWQRGMAWACAHRPMSGPPSLVGMLLVLQTSHVAITPTLIVCLCDGLDAWNVHICFFRVSVSQHEAKLGQRHQQGQVGENTEAQI